MKKWIALLLTFALCLSLVACTKDDDTDSEDCDHNYKKATCTAPQKCKDCGKSKGKALGHDYVGICTTGIACSRCGKVQMKPTAHQFVYGVCEICGLDTSAITTPTLAPEYIYPTYAPEYTYATYTTDYTYVTEATGYPDPTMWTDYPFATEAIEENWETTPTYPKATKPRATTRPTATKATAKPTKPISSTKATAATKPAATVKPTTKPATKPVATTVPTTKPATKPATKPVATTLPTTAKPTAAIPTAAKPTVPIVTTPNSTQPYKGKTLQIYGMGTETSYTDFSQFNEQFTWMQKAAAMEWATMNGVTLEFKGTYDQNTVISDINAGGYPDLIYQANAFPGIANVGIVAAFTDAEYNKLAAICGNEWLDMMKYGTKSHGFVIPWTGTMMCYYNKTMFEDYGVTTPKEHFLAGNWTWEQFAETMQEMTMDVDADGTIDTYGLNGDSWVNIVNPWKENAKGELVSTIDEPWMRDFFQLKYDAYTVNKVTRAGKMSIAYNVIYPMFAMQFSDCQVYNFEHFYQYIPNGNELEVAPVPEWRGENGETLGTSKVTQQAFHMASSCDERAATIDLLCYILQCGLKYMSDYSLGAVKCDYPGLQGTCELSVNYLNAFAKMNKRRAKEIQELIEDGIYDAEYIAKMNEYLNDRSRYIWGPHTGVSVLTDYAEITKMPPESAIPAIRNKYQNALNTYNKLYIN